MFVILFPYCSRCIKYRKDSSPFYREFKGLNYHFFTIFLWKKNTNLRWQVIWQFWGFEDLKNRFHITWSINALICRKIIPLILQKSQKSSYTPQKRTSVAKTPISVWTLNALQKYLKWYEFEIFRHIVFHRNIKTLQYPAVTLLPFVFYCYYWRVTKISTD